MNTADENGAVVYRLYSADGELLYVGQTRRLKLRLQEHRSRLQQPFARVEFDGPFERKHAQRIEFFQIVHLAPRLNKENNYQRGWRGLTLSAADLEEAA